MSKAFEEMEELGWIGSARRKMIVVQAAACAPILKAWSKRQTTSEPWQNAETLAAGLRVPKAHGDYIILDILQKSRGTAVAVTDGEIMTALLDWSRDEGIFAAPEGAAALAGYRKLRDQGFLKRGNKVVLFNTGSGLKYIGIVASYLQSHGRPEEAGSVLQVAGRRALGGLIQPY